MAAEDSVSYATPDSNSIGAVSDAETRFLLGTDRCDSTRSTAEGGGDEDTTNKKRSRVIRDDDDDDDDDDNDDNDDNDEVSHTYLSFIIQSFDIVIMILVIHDQPFGH